MTFKSFVSQILSDYLATPTTAFIRDLFGSVTINVRVQSQRLPKRPTASKLILQEPRMNKKTNAWTFSFCNHLIGCSSIMFSGRIQNHPHEPSHITHVILSCSVSALTYHHQLRRRNERVMCPQLDSLVLAGRTIIPLTIDYGLN